MKNRLLQSNRYTYTACKAVILAWISIQYYNIEYLVENELVYPDSYGIFWCTEMAMVLWMSFVYWTNRTILPEAEYEEIKRSDEEICLLFLCNLTWLIAFLAVVSFDFGMAAYTNKVDRITTLGQILADDKDTNSNPSDPFNRGRYYLVDNLSLVDFQYKQGTYFYKPNRGRRKRMGWINAMTTIENGEGEDYRSFLTFTKKTEVSGFNKRIEKDEMNHLNFQAWQTFFRQSNRNRCIRVINQSKREHYLEILTNSDSTKRPIFFKFVQPSRCTLNNDAIYLYFSGILIILELYLAWLINRIYPKVLERRRCRVEEVNQRWKELLSSMPNG